MDKCTIDEKNTQPHVLKSILRIQKWIFQSTVYSSQRKTENCSRD